jgi:hypothetical protein
MGFVGAFARAFRVGILPAMPGRGHRLRAARATAAMCAAIAVVGVSAAGCDSHSKPQAVDHPASPASAATTGSPTPSASATAVAPSSLSGSPLAGESALNSAFPSAAARIPDAIETVRRFFDGINHESDTGDEGPAIATFTTKCSLCGSEVYSIKNLLDGGHKLSGGHLHLLSINSAVATYGNAISIDVTESQDAAQQLDVNGRVVRAFPASLPRHLVIELETDDSPPKIWQLTRADQ